MKIRFVSVLSLLAAAATVMGQSGLAAATTAAETTAQGSPSFGSQTERVDRYLLQDVAETLSAYWNDPDYGDVVIDPLHNAITVQWKGAVPRAVIDAAAGAPAGVTVTIEPVPYSAADLAKAENAIVQDSINRGDSDLVDVMAASDMSGVVAEVKKGSLSASSPAATSRGYSALTGGVPVDLATIAGGAPVLLSRHNSSAPWKGGAEIRSGGAFCSSGFAVDTSSGYGRLLTSAHCGDNGSTWTDGTGEVIGPVIARKRDTIDSMLIDPTASPATTGIVFGGPWDATSLNARYQLSVGGSSAPSTGDTVCSNGAMSGEHCNKTIVTTSVSWNCGGYTCEGFKLADYVYPNSVAGAQGDSGGPVYVNRSDGRVGARGIMTTGYTPVTCGSTAYPDTTCYAVMYAVGITRLTSHWGVTVETN
jgi:hypothetical protein